MERELYPTFRYVRIKFDGTAKLYTYRCNFETKAGDRLRVPTIYGDKDGTVKSTCADDHAGYEALVEELAAA